MSTKIYGAFKYHGGMDTLMADLHKLRDRRKERVFNQLAQLLIAKGGDDKASTTIREQVIDVMDNPDNHGYLSILSSIVVFFDIDPNNKRAEKISSVLGDDYQQSPDIYIQLLGCNDLEKDLDKGDFPMFTDYHYQNQTDTYWEYSDDYERYTDKQLEDFQDDWDNREKVWDRIYDNYEYVSEAGLILDIFSSNVDKRCFMLMLNVEREVEKIKKGLKELEEIEEIERV